MVPDCLHTAPLLAFAQCRHVAWPTAHMIHRSLPTAHICSSMHQILTTRHILAQPRRILTSSINHVTQLRSPHAFSRQPPPVSRHFASCCDTRSARVRVQLMGVWLAGRLYTCLKRTVRRQAPRWPTRPGEKGSGPLNRPCCEAATDREPVFRLDLLLQTAT